MSLIKIKGKTFDEIINFKTRKSINILSKIEKHY